MRAPEKRGPSDLRPRSGKASKWRWLPGVLCAGVAAVLLAPTKDQELMGAGERQLSTANRAEEGDDQKNWDLMWEFRAAPTRQNTDAVFQLLEEKLQDWNSHCDDLIEEILMGIGEHRIERGRKYLVRYLNADRELAPREQIASWAALALGRLGGKASFDTLSRATPRASPELLKSIAVALGTLRDDRAVSVLEELAETPDAEIRHRAIAGLASYCSASSRATILTALADPTPRVRNSAAYWLAQCGRKEDDARLALMLHDDYALVRKNALAGLIRLGSTAACEMLPQLLADANLSVRLEAKSYEELCHGR